jgi:predicted Fe-Mo cluster-binding NifX family protein
MKIAVTAKGDNLDCQVDPRFGRAGKFIIFDTETENFEVVDNTQNYQAAQGAGIQSAGNVVETGAEAVISGHCGPKAFRVLSTAGIKIYAGAEGTVREMLDKFQRGELTENSTADVEGHWV